MYSNFMRPLLCTQIQVNWWKFKGQDIVYERSLQVSERDIIIWWGPYKDDAYTNSAWGRAGKKKDYLLNFHKKNGHFIMDCQKYRW